ncbi:MAG TPA: hypothetical protein VNA28_03780 [Solirubrobacteraceae bacterium]|nr:hypothetical protein [Solirubrobacteraceae bacterium]
MLASATAAFAATRAVNGALALIGTAVPVAVAGAAQAGDYFALWTATWICGVAARFGADAVLPRLVAEQPGVSGLALVRGRSALGAISAVLLAPAACAALGVLSSPWEVVLVAATALVWGRTFVIAGVLRARMRVVAAGIAANVVWSLAGVAGPLAAAIVFADPSAAQLLGALLAASLVALGIVRAMLGWIPDGDDAAVAHRAPRPRGGDELVGAAAVSTVYEIATWSPMIYAGLAGLSPTATAAIFAATRLAGVASWGYQAIVATTGPQIARAFVARDAATVQALVRRGGRLGLLVTLPLVVVGYVVAGPATELLLGMSVAASADALRALLIGRLVDAATGPVSEAFVLGRRIWLDVGLFSASLLAGAIVVIATRPSVLGVAGIAAATSITTNLVRAGLFGSLLIAPIARRALT